MATEEKTIFLYVPMMAYGAARRKYIKDLFIKNPKAMYCVNAKWRPQVKADPDLKKLIRIGFLKQVRQHISKTHATTFLVMV